jgi:hypothetical protein
VGEQHHDELSIRRYERGSYQWAIDLGKFRHGYAIVRRSRMGMKMADKNVAKPMSTSPIVLGEGILTTVSPQAQFLVSGAGCMQISSLQHSYSRHHVPAEG